MIDLGYAYFCCDECPICEDLERRLELAEKYGEFQYDYCGCDKTVESKFLYNGGGCSDWLKPKEAPSRDGKRKTGRAYRRKMTRQKFEKKKKIGTYVHHACWVDWDEVDGEWVPVGKYIKYPNDSEARSYFKKYSNRKVRRTRHDDISMKGNGYRRQFDYWWTLY
jgi:hypothetical protein